MKYYTRIKYLDGKTKTFKFEKEEERDMFFVDQLNGNDNIDTIEWF